MAFETSLSDAAFRSLLDETFAAGSDCVLVCAVPLGSIVYVSPAFRRMIGGLEPWLLSALGRLAAVSLVGDGAVRSVLCGEYQLAAQVYPLSDGLVALRIALGRREDAIVRAVREMEACLQGIGALRRAGSLYQPPAVRHRCGGWRR